VRSSADVEDSSTHSFAGQFASVLNVEHDGLRAAVEKVLSSTTEPSTASYRRHAGVDPRSVRMSVIIQEMVAQVVSGVVFSCDPLTGEEAVVTEMVQGSGELILQEGRSPTRCVISWKGRGGASLLPIAAQEELEAAARRMASRSDFPVDMEFIFDGERLWYVQVREITGLREIKVYSNTFSKEFLPGMIKPLVWSINNPLVNGAWARLFTEMTGKNDIDSRDLGRLFYYRAYFNMSAVGQVWQKMGLPRDSLEALMMSGGRGGSRMRPTPQVMALVPRLAIFALDKARFRSKLEAFMRKARPRFQAFRAAALKDMSDEDISRHLDSLFALNSEAAYHNIVTMLLAALYERALRSRLGKAGISPEAIDLSSPELRSMYPTDALCSMHTTYLGLDEEAQKAFKERGADALQGMDQAQPLKERMDEFLRDFGHLSDSSNDFSCAPWEEDPLHVARMVIEMEEPPRRPGGKDLPGHHLLISGLAARAKKYRVLRERMSSLYAYGYGTFRIYYLEIGRRLVAKQVLLEADDIFYLYAEEVAQILSGGCEGNQCNNYRLRAFMRRREMEEQRDIIPPDVIYGEVPPPIRRVRGDILTGVAASPGYFSGQARVVHGSHDFDKVLEGEVIIIPYSDVAWTPLFAKAGAVVSESGGLLSHSSIVAREYGIPAVVSVTGAMGIPDGTVLDVDGFKGVVSAATAPARSG
jgi:pyruvate,water dikinase